MNLRFIPMDRNMLLADLRAQVAEVVFQKVDDGSIRTMHCTLNNAFLPEGTDIIHAQGNDGNVVTVWDVDANDWRRFRLDRVLSIQAVNR